MEFGIYPQSNKPISFRKIVAEEFYNIFLTEETITARCFHDKYEKHKIYWDNSSLNDWLQHDFLLNFFSEMEQAKLMEISIPTIEQLLSWFPNRTDRKCYASEQAILDGITLFPDSDNSCAYWLQDTGRRDGMSATVILPNGGIYQSAYMLANNVGVRPYVKIRK